MIHRREINSPILCEEIMKEGGHINSGLEQNSGRKSGMKTKSSRKKFNDLGEEIMPLGVDYQVSKRGFIKENKLLGRL